ncbi:hypothetical protein LWC34_37445 [Kibdelosporangium philippinense]|uniref:Uncharacterized protein n=1 Tax=Kibdelosporangium philippinense TaxID=211113 RepID=A0ABS8ZMR5_9PSEU|nr:hypothetical protein [Kibdelosporangium philippinense]MCE7008458.1 hypothetical protein [Kibdelosporangium philippinense]
MGRRRSPQEKKRLSYSKDRRNWYGENDKSSRKAIALRKRLRHRAARHEVHQELASVIGQLGKADELFVTRRKPDYWRKWPDAQLGAYVMARLAVRARRGISEASTEQARIERIRRATVFDHLETPSKGSLHY